MLRVRNASVFYGNTCAVADVSLDAAAGCITCIVGPNGAGKSSLLRGICGLETLRSGFVEFEGQSIRGLAPEFVARRGLTLVPEGRQIFQTLTVRENLNMPVRLGGQVADGIDDVCEMFPVLRQRLDSPAGLLSGGEQQMLAIARALVMRPRLIMIDEPSLGLAPLVVATVYECFERLRASGVALLIVEQSVARVLAIADYAYLLSKGRVVMAGTPAETAAGLHLDQAYFGGAQPHAGT